ncbi:hypothetical protein D3C86_260100 [compost metagenome]
MLFAYIPFYILYNDPLTIMYRKIQRKLLELFCVISVVAIILINFVWADIPEKIDNGFEIGSLLNNLALAYLSSYIFYLVVVVSKERLAKRSVYSFVYSNTQKLVESGFEVFEIIQRAQKGDKLSFEVRTLTFDNFDLLSRKVKINSTSNTFFISNGGLYPGITGKLVYDAGFVMVNKIIDEILIFNFYLDPAFIAILAKVKMHPFQTTVKQLNNIANMGTFNFYKDHIYSYLLLFREIEKYNNEFNFKYIRLSRFE